MEYLLQAPAADMYRLEIEGGSHIRYTTGQSFTLRIWVDGEYVGASVLFAPALKNGRAHAYTPWLKAGEHRVRIYWDNVASDRSLAIAAVRLQTLRGTEVAENGVSAWVQKRLQNLCGVDASSNAIVFSAVSPACLEGRGGYLSMMTISDGLTPHAGGGNRWYANVPLKAGERRPVVCSFQNDGLIATNQIFWTPTDLTTANDLIIRQGDSLLFTAGAAGLKAAAKIDIAGQANFAVEAGQAAPYQFNTAGDFTVNANFTTAAGASSNRSLKVSVVSADLGNQPAGWAAKAREWKPKQLPANGTVQADSRAQLELTGGNTNGQPAFNLTLDTVEPRGLVARLGTNGPVSASVTADGFRVFSGSLVYLRRTAKYEDGSELIAMGIVVYPVLPGVTLRVQSHAAGITFDDGTIVKEFKAGDFDELGQASVRFLKPASAKTSVCHRITAWQGDVFLGEFWSTDDTGL